MSTTSSMRMRQLRNFGICLATLPLWLLAACGGGATDSPAALAQASMADAGRAQALGSGGHGDQGAPDEHDKDEHDRDDGDKDGHDKGDHDKGGHHGKHHKHHHHKLPQLPPAVPATLPVTCEQLAATLGAPAPAPLPVATAVRFFAMAAGDVSPMAAGTPTPLPGPIPDTTITTVTTVPPATNVPEHCLVTGKMFERVSAVDGQTYAIGFEMRLPIDWNGRFFHQGNGGIDGASSRPPAAFGGGPLTSALLQGFAVLSSDAGHAARTDPFFGIDPQARLDYGYQAVGKLTPMAKSVIADRLRQGPGPLVLRRLLERRAPHAWWRRPAMPTSTTASWSARRLQPAQGRDGQHLRCAAYAARSATNPADLSTAFTAAERQPWPTPCWRAATRSTA